MPALPPPLPATLSGRKKMGWNSPCQTSPCASSSPSSARASRSGSHAQSLHASPAQTPPALRTAQSPRAVLRASQSQSPRAIRSQALPSVEKPLPRDSRVERPLSPSLFTADSSPQPAAAAAADPSVGLSQETVASHLLGHRRCARHARRHRALGPARRAHLASASLHCREPFYCPRLAARGRNPVNAAAPRCHTAGDQASVPYMLMLIGECIVYNS